MCVCVCVCVCVHDGNTQSQTLHDGNTQSALPFHITFNDLDHSLEPKQCETVLAENFMFVSDEVDFCMMCQLDYDYPTIFFCIHFQGR